MSIGIPALDKDHRSLLGLFNELLQGMSHGWSRMALLATGETLEESIRDHFRDEQKLLEQLTLPDGIVHRLEHLERHEDFLLRIGEMRHELAVGQPRLNQLEAMILSLADFELVRYDFQMVGHLLRERKLNSYRPDCLSA